MTEPTLTAASAENTGDAQTAKPQAWATLRSAVGYIVHYHQQSDDKHVVPAIVVRAYKSEMDDESFPCPPGDIDALVVKRDGSTKFLTGVPYGPGEFGHWGFPE